MTEKEQQTITLINPKPQPKSPSLLGNMFVMVALFGLIWGGEILTKKWSTKPVAVPEAVQEEAKGHIVLEDLESEQPMAESAPVVMPTEDRRLKTEDRRLNDLPAGRQAEDRRPKKKVAKKLNKQRNTQHAARTTIYNQPDPYTDGGPQDLDRLENREQHELPVKTVTATPPTPLDERDEFIPFEK